MRSTIRRVVRCCAVLFLAGGCAGHLGDSVDEPAAEASGRLSFGLIVDEGFALKQVRYTITNTLPDEYLYTAEVSYADLSSEDFSLYLALPEATDYELSVEAELVNGGICTGRSEFDITTDERTEVYVLIRCPQNNNLGRAQIEGRVNSCPAVTAVSALPSVAGPEDAVALQAQGSDPDRGPQPLTYSWSSNTGVLGDSNLPAATFVCSEPGPAAVQLTLSDGHEDCNATLTLTIDCIEAPATANAR